MDHKVVIVGGGFGGIAAALTFCYASHKSAKVALISDRDHFEYHAAMYRVVTGRSPHEVCIPLEEIFTQNSLELIRDKITRIDLHQKILTGESGKSYRANKIILAVGSQPSYYDVSGARKAFNFNSFADAWALKCRLHQKIDNSKQNPPKNIQIVIVGAGSSGVELAGELAQYLKTIAIKHQLDPTRIMIDLIEAAPHILPALPELRVKVEKRLRQLGINIFVNTTVSAKLPQKIILNGIELETEMVIWTAGVAPNQLIEKIESAKDKKGRLIIDPYLRLKNYQDIYAVGDIASGPSSGMAQTALSQGALAAQNILLELNGKPLIADRIHRPVNAIPVGRYWAAVKIGPCRFYGIIGWFWRRAADWLVFASFLPLLKAVQVFKEGMTLSEECVTCRELTEANRSSEKIDLNSSRRPSKS